MNTWQRTIWRKTCKCKNATATTQQLRTQTNRDDKGAIVVTTTYSPGPSCDKCGEPWQQEIPLVTDAERIAGP